MDAGKGDEEGAFGGKFEKFLHDVEDMIDADCVRFAESEKDGDVGPVSARIGGDHHKEKQKSGGKQPLLIAD